MLTGSRPGEQVAAVASQSAAPMRKQGVSALRTLIGLGALAVVGVILFRSLQTGTYAPPQSPRSPEAPVSSPRQVVAKSQVIVDEEVAVPASAWQSRSFKLLSPQPVQVVAEGKAHADKGFALYVVDEVEFENLRRRATFQHVSAFQGLKVRSFSKTVTLGAGAWTVVVVNSENLLNTTVVHLRVVVNPTNVVRGTSAE